ncbi:MAG TPA: carbon-nitrogen hydrolase family protein [Phycisphaerales bacterium]|nr:carbon-nitrogen hydrolase family protein [Phycisphaerales bacterium]
MGVSRPAVKGFSCICKTGSAQMRSIKVAMCQIFSLDGDRSGNFVRIENAIGEAKDAGADIACFPETALLGWVNPDAHKRARPIPGEDSDQLCKLAGDYDLHLCIGLAEKDGWRLYDSVVLIDNKGNILLKHRKINLLTELMSPPYTPGEDVNVIETGFGRVGLLICADTHNSKILKRMAALKPDLLLVPYGYATAEDEWPGHGRELDKVVTNTARKTGAFVIGINLVGEITHGPWRGRIYGGQSVAVDKTGRIISVAKDRDRDINIININIGQ